MPTVGLSGRGTVAYQMSRELVELLPEAKLVEFEGITHMGPMMLRKKAKPVFERYVAFMEKVLRG